MLVPCSDSIKHSKYFGYAGVVLLLGSIYSNDVVS